MAQAISDSHAGVAASPSATARGMWARRSDARAGNTVRRISGARTAPPNRRHKHILQEPQPPALRLTHLPFLHKEDVQRVQGTEVEDVDVVFYCNLGWKDRET